MKKILVLIMVVFTLLTFAGAFYVLKNNGAVNAGYAVVPCVIVIAIAAYIHRR